MSKNFLYKKYYRNFHNYLMKNQEKHFLNILLSPYPKKIYYSWNLLKFKFESKETASVWLLFKWNFSMEIFLTYGQPTLLLPLYPSIFFPQWAMIISPNSWIVIVSKLNDFHVHKINIKSKYWYLFNSEMYLYCIFKHSFLEAVFYASRKRDFFKNYLVLLILRCYYHDCAVIIY